MDTLPLPPTRPPAAPAPAHPRLCFVGPMLGVNPGWVTSQGEILAGLLAAEGYPVRQTSHHIARLPRLADTLRSLFAWRDEIDLVIHQVYSGPAFVVTDLASALCRALGLRQIFTLHGGSLPEFAAARPGWVRRVLSRADYITAPSAYLIEQVATPLVVARVGNPRLQPQRNAGWQPALQGGTQQDAGWQPALQGGTQQDAGWQPALQGGTQQDAGWQPALQAEGRCRVIPNVLEIEEYPYRHRPAVAPRLLWMRTFHDIYHPQLALEVLADLRRSHPAATLTMAGQEKGLHAAIVAQAREMGLAEAVRFPGFLDAAAKQREFAAHDIFLNTNRVDNMPVSVVEAAAFGLPVVATAVGGVPTLLDDGRTGLLTPPEDAPAMAAAVRRLLAEPALAAALSANGRRLAESCAWEPVRAQWQQLFQEALHA